MLSPTWIIRAAAAALALAGLAAPAAAVVGGAEDGGPLSRVAVMVLSAGGGTCSGVVVAPDAVLTAAHCVRAPAATRVYFREPDGAPALLEPVATVTHRGFDRGAVKGRRRSIDLALVRLPAPLPGRFGAATLATGAPAKGTDLSLAGFGVVRPDDGRSSGTLRSTRLVAAEPYGRSTILLWAAPPAGAKAGACGGDSGGPIAGPDGTVAAVTSWAAGADGKGCGTMTQGVLVGPQRAWIDATLAGWERTAAWQ